MTKSQTAIARRCPGAFAALAVLGLGLSSPPAASAAKISKESFVSEGAERTYYLAGPKAIEPGARVPLVLLLHGSGRDGRSLVEKWNRLAEKESFLVAGLDSKVSDYWAPPGDGPAPLRDLVDHLSAEYPVDPRRVYLFGHSAGGSFALQMGLLESRYFAAVAVHAGALQNGSETWLPERATRKIPIYIAVGDRDAYFPLPTVHATGDALEAEGIPVTLVEMPNHDHWYYDKAPRINAAAWEFLSAHALEDDPVYEERRFQ